jgi:hypothetical protein
LAVATWNLPLRPIRAFSKPETERGKQMRRILGVALAAALALGALGAPAGAGKFVTKKKKFTAGPHAPAPVLVDVDPNGCLNTVEGVNKTTVPYKTPKRGTFTAKIFNFEGDWDLYVTTGSGSILGSSTSDQTIEQAPPTEKVVLKLGARKKVNVVACNWLGRSPTADGLIMFKYRR